MTDREEVDDQTVVYTGVALVLVAVLLIAVGANIQRYALRSIPREARSCGCVSTRSAVWFGGLSIYFFANVLYTIGLVYAPASLCATLMAAIIPINALTSRIILGEFLELVDVEGGLCITAGISLAAYAAPYTTASYDAYQLRALFIAPDAVALLAAAASVLVVLCSAVLCHERLSAPARRVSFAPDVTKPPPSCPGACMPFAYPLVVGLLESLVQVAQKGGSSMVALTLSGESQVEEAVFWYFIGAWGGVSLLVVWWLRKGLSAIAANRMLPIEYGTFTAVSVLSGLVCYDEARFVSSEQRKLMAVGVLLVGCGCTLVGSRRALRCEMALRCTSDDDDVAERVRRALALLRSAAPEHLRNGSHGQLSQLSERLLPVGSVRSDVGDITA